MKIARKKQGIKIVTILFIGFCQNISILQAQNTLLSEMDVLEFPLRERERLDPVHPVYCNFADVMGIMYIDYANKDLVFRTLTGGKDSVRNIKFYNYQFVQNFLLLENGQALFAMNANYFGGNHNKCLLKYSSNNVLLDTIDANIVEIEKFRDRRSRDSFYFSVFTYSDILLHAMDSAVYVPVTPYTEFFAPKSNRDLVVFMKVHFSKQAIEPTPIVLRDFWSLSDSILFPMDLKFPRTEETDRFIYFGFGFTPDLYRLNKKNQRIKTIKVHTNLNELYPNKAGDYTDDRYGTMLNYRNIYYDKENNWFVRTVLLPVDDSANPIYQNYRSTLIQKIKPNGKVIEERELPFGFTDQMLVINSEYWFYNRYESERKKSLVFAKYMESANEIPLKTDSEIGILPYIQQITFGNVDGNYLLIPLDNSCSSCLVQLEALINKHIEMMHNDKLKIVFITQYEDRINTFFSTLKIENERRDNWLFDVDNTIKSYEKLWVNPRFMQVEQGEVVFDEIYNPLQLYDLFDVLLRFCD
ncbi:hypothetical protein GC194_03095 [bacterium]|nr:hypothetical protein [bacterium]